MSWSDSFRSDMLSVLLATIWGTLIIMCLLLLYWQYNLLPLEIPLFYSLPWGASRMTPRDTIWILPASGVLIGFINFGLGLGYHREERYLALILLGANILVMSFIFVALFHTILILIW